jgi:hypothetical protein
MKVQHLGSADCFHKYKFTGPSARGDKGRSLQMRDNNDLDAAYRRPKKKVKQKKRAVRSPLRIALFVGAGLAGLLVIGLLIWGVVSLFSGGGGRSGAVVAQARAADKNPEAGVLPLEQVPAASGWKVRQDGLRLASGLTSAVVLPEGKLESVLFSAPAQAQAAVILSSKPSRRDPTKRGAYVAAYPLEWVQVDLKTGRVSSTSLGESEVGQNDHKPVTNAALSPSGERLAIIVPSDGTLLHAFQVWDKAGKKLMHVKASEFSEMPKTSRVDHIAGFGWFGFVSESRLLIYGAGKLVALDVPSGKVAYAVGDGLKPPFALSPGRQWVGATTAADRFQCFATADGSPAGEIATPNIPYAAGFSPDGSTLALSFGNFAFWDVSTGKPTGVWPPAQPAGGFRIERPAIDWFGGDYLMFGNRLFDRQRNVTLSEYNPGQLWVAWSGSPDGRLWSAGNFKELLGAGVRDKLVTPGPIVDAGLKDKNLLAAYTVPHSDAKARLEKHLSGITFRAGDPARIEVTGGGSTSAKQLLADTAAEELAKRGKAVEPSAKVGVRIQLSEAKRTQRLKSHAVEYIGHPPPGALRDVYEMEARVYLINVENGSMSQTPRSLTKVAYVEDPNWETALCKGLGKAIGMTQIPLSGSYTATGEETGLPAQARLGIDGVLP